MRILTNRDKNLELFTKGRETEGGRRRRKRRKKREGEINVAKYK